MKWFNNLSKESRKKAGIAIFVVGAILIGLVWIAALTLYLLIPGIGLAVFAIALQKDAEKHDKEKAEEKSDNDKPNGNA